MTTIKQSQYRTRGGLEVRRSSAVDNYSDAMGRLASQLDDHRGLLLSSSYEYPGRYTRWDIGFVNPPLQLTANNRDVRIEALNRRGEILLPAVFHGLKGQADLLSMAHDARTITLELRKTEGGFAEEQRSRQPSVFSVLRSLIELFGSECDAYLGLYGA
ncbi:MAG: anthranilate synthase component I, partial [Gammaproteobacteria bacterium]|nr:anthranilate synthase component I [Gammaproteobacteria bacterium]